MKSAFRSSSTPKVSDEELQGTVALLIKLLAHRVDDPDLDAIGGENQAGLERWFSIGDLVKLADPRDSFPDFVSSGPRFLRLPELEKIRGHSTRNRDYVVRGNRSAKRCK